MRVEFSKKQRIAIWDRAAGRCEGCQAKLKVGEGEYDHRIPYALTRDTSVENGQLLCKVCHSGKTHKTDRPTISKAERMAAKHKGITKPKGWNSFGKNARFKKKLNGLVVLRDD